MSHFIKFILFDFLKKYFKIYCSYLLFIITVHELLFTVTIGHNTKIVLQHISSSPLLSCNTISLLQYNSSLSPPIGIHFLMLQYNLTPSSKSQYNIVLQYKLSPQAFFTAIQFCVLQHNASTTSPSHVTIQCLSCNTISLPFFSSPLSCNTIARLAIQFFFLHNTTDSAANFFIFFQNFSFHYIFFPVISIGDTKIYIHFFLQYIQ